MTADTLPPFSSRNLGARAQIDRDFPQTARIGLLHLLHEGVGKGYVAGWQNIATELLRIARKAPKVYSYSAGGDALADAEEILAQLPWEKSFDFCERLYGYLAQEASARDEDGDYCLVATKSDVKAFFLEELQRLFLEENLAFEFRDGQVQRRGRRHSVDRISRAEAVLGDSRLQGARKHFVKALRYFRDPSKPDPENAVKEAVCAVEAAAKDLFPEAKAATLGDAIKWLAGPEAGKLPKASGQTFSGLYGFRSGGDGVGHGGSSGGIATISIAEYALAVAASQIILLVDLANAQENEVPF